MHGPAEARRVPDNGQALTAPERTAVLELINRQVYADLSIGQIWARELDEGSYLCSMSSMYRIARAAGQTRERRRQATHPAKVKPELMADAPSQVWSWDITKLRGPAKGVWFHLYVLIDIFSRFNPGWIVSPVEDSASGDRLHRRGDRPQRVGAAHGARRPGHVDDVEAGVGVADRSRASPARIPGRRCRTTTRSPSRSSEP